MSEISERDKFIARNSYTAGTMDAGTAAPMLTDEEVANLVEFAPPALTWSDEPPTEPGWYWIEDEYDPSEVFPMADVDDLFVCRQDERGEKVFCVVADVQLRWSGPLLPPPIPLPEIGE